jgi:hypothetical protein
VERLTSWTTGGTYRRCSSRKSGQQAAPVFFRRANTNRQMDVGVQRCARGNENPAPAWFPAHVTYTACMPRLEGQATQPLLL